MPSRSAVLNKRVVVVTCLMAAKVKGQGGLILAALALPPHIMSMLQ